MWIGSTADLEAIKESYMNMVNELNGELLALKDAYQELDAEKQDLINKLEEQPLKTEFLPVDLSDEVCIILYCIFYLKNNFDLLRFLCKQVV